MSVSVILPTLGRPTLQRSIDSILSQLLPGDELLIQVDSKPHKDDGNWCRDEMIARAQGTHLWFLDDDDIALPGAIEAFHQAISEAPEVCWIFRILLCGNPMWKVPGKIMPGNQQGQCLLVPRLASPQWVSDGYGSDYHYLQRIHIDKKWASPIIAQIRPPIPS